MRWLRADPHRARGHPKPAWSAPSGGHGPWRRVTAVGEGMDHDAVCRQSAPMGELHQSLDVAVDGVDASGTDEPQDVEARVAIQRMTARGVERAIGVERAVVYGLGDPREV